MATECSNMTEFELAAAVAASHKRLDALIKNLERLSETAEFLGFQNTMIDLDFTIRQLAERLDTLETRSITPLS
jgi:hypothetical protein